MARVRHLLVALLLFLVGARAFAAEPAFTPPVLKQRIQAVYPPEAAAAGREGSVVMDLYVDAEGRVTDAKVIASAGEDLDRAAALAVKQFRFEPGKVDGQPVPVKVTYRYAFKLEHKPPPAAGAPVAEPPVRLYGLVAERGTRARLSGVAVIVLDDKDTQLGRAETEADGSFRVRLPADLAGEVRVVLAAPDHKTVRLKEKLRAHEALTVKYVLPRSSYAQYESTVRTQPVREEVARVSLDGDEIRRIPGTKGDALQAVLNLPSVARSPFDLGQLVIRGSQPGESGAFLSGMSIPQPFHFALGTSTFNSYLLERFDLIPSNFSVRYGRLVGGLVDIVPREGKHDRIHGDLKIDLFDAHAIVEGPIGKGSFALSFRRSYADAILGAVLPSNSFTVAPRYYDYQALLDYPLAGGKLKLIVFGSDDELAFVQKTPPDSDPSLAGAFNTRFYFHTLIASYTKKWQKLELETSLQFGGQHSDAALGGAARFDLSLIETDVRAELRYKATPTTKITAGLDLQTDYYWVDVLAPSPTTEEKVQPPISLDTKKHLNNQGFEPYPAVYAQVDWKPKEWFQVTPGVRVDWFAHKNKTYVQPRVSARLRVAHETWLKAGAGLYYEPPQAPYDDAVLGNPAVRPEQAVHVTVGVETRPIRRWRPLLLDVNLFYKDLRYLAVGSEQYVLRDGKVVPEVYTDEGYGRVYGGDVLLKHDSQRWVYGWIAYTLLKSERQDHPGEPFRPFQYDQTNILTLVVGTHLPKDIDVGIRLRWVTGNPDTSQLANGLTVYDSDRDTHYPGFNAPFSSRLPDFFQLDVRIDKRFVFKSWIFAVYLECTNITNRANVEGYLYSYDFTRRAPVTGLPILPSLGLRASF